MKNRRKFFVCIIVFIILLVLSEAMLSYAAKSKSELEDEKSELQNKINQTEKELSEIQSNLSVTLKSIQKTITEISTYEDEIENLENQIAEVENQIKVATEELNKAEDTYNKQKESLQKRLVAIYESGETQYLDVLLSSASILDFISKYSVVEDMAEYDSELLERMETNKLNIDIAKQTLEKSEEQLVSLKTSKQVVAQSLKEARVAKEQYADELSEEEKATKEELEQFEADKRAIQSELIRLAQNENIVASSVPSSFGYIFPVQGLTIYNINNRNYPSYVGHTGVDVNINVRNKNVVAVKDGTVAISRALKNSNGTYRSYGEYIVINHHDGSMTLYAHMQPNSRTVFEGDTVVQGQVIGIVGTTGKSTGIHLHFEVRINGRCVNPLPYLP